jgi:hypothetical protein
MKTTFKKDWYNETITGKDGVVQVLPELKTMYHLSISENYFTDDKQLVLDRAIKDLENELARLKEIKNRNDKVMDSWDSISK